MPLHFLELTPGDFDAYLPERANSNAFSRPRLEFKQRAIGWAKQVEARLRSTGISVDVCASDEHPSIHNDFRVDCQWIFFLRPLQQRQNIDIAIERRTGLALALRESSNRHAFLAMRLDAKSIQASAQLPHPAWFDREALRARLSDDQRANRIAAIIARLPSQFRIGLSGNNPNHEPAPHTATSCTTAETLRRIVDEQESTQNTIRIGWEIERDTALASSGTIDEQLAEALVALGPVYTSISWQHDDDPTGISVMLETTRAELANAAAHRREAERTRQEQSDRLSQEQTARTRQLTKERVMYNATKKRTNLADLFKPAVAKAGSDTPAPRNDSTHAVRHESSKNDHDESSGAADNTDRTPHSSSQTFANQHTDKRSSDAGEHVIATAFSKAAFAQSHEQTIATQESSNRERPPTVQPLRHPSYSQPCANQSAPTNEPPERAEHLTSSEPKPVSTSESYSLTVTTADVEPESPSHNAVDGSLPREPNVPELVAGGTVEKGAMVRVVSGPFAGRVGSVTGVDGRGSARVLLGLLPAKLSIAQLEAVVEAKDRPAMQSSHRKNAMSGRSSK